jgi:hypothetical protein
MGRQLRNLGFSIEAQLNPPLPLALLDTDGLIIEGSSCSGSSSCGLAAIFVRIEVQTDAIAGEVTTAGVEKTGSGS